MKQLILTLALLGVTYLSNAQNSTDYDEKANQKKIKLAKTDANQFLGTEMSVTKDLASFTNLPEMPKPTWAIVTNEEGELIKEAKINPTYNAMDIHRLPKGMYFVTLVYRNKSKKAFVLNVEE